METNYSRALGDCVRTARKRKNLTQAQLADMIHSDKRTILNIENYRGNPKLDTLYDLITYLDINPQEIFFPELKNREALVSQFEVLLADCSEEQIILILQICTAVISSLQSQDQIPIV